MQQMIALVVNGRRREVTGAFARSSGGRSSVSSVVVGVFERVESVMVRGSVVGSSVARVKAPPRAALVTWR